MYSFVNQSYLIYDAMPQEWWIWSECDECFMLLGDNKYEKNWYGNKNNLKLTMIYFSKINNIKKRKKSLVTFSSSVTSFKIKHNNILIQ